MTHQRHPIVVALEKDSHTLVLSTVIKASKQSVVWTVSTHLRDMHCPSAIVESHREPDDFEPGAERHGWQHEASSRVERARRERAGLALSVTSSNFSSRIESNLFWELLLRRFR